VTGAAVDATLPLVFVNGERVPTDGSHLSVRDRGFTLADGLFETMRARRNVVFREARHLARLSDGLRVMQIPEPRHLRRWVEQAVAGAGRMDVSIRLTITRGAGAAGLTPPADVKPTVVVTVSPMPHFPAETYTRGLSAIIASGRRNAGSMTAGLKTLSYTDAVLAWLEAQRAGADEALFLDEHGHCSEATASNLFIVVEGGLVTPPVTCAALPGITRATILELAKLAGIRAEEREFSADVMASAQEAFLTSSLRGIAPLRSVDNRNIGRGAPGEVTTRLRSAYAALVDRECGGS
jgi:branched-chain amino acid aminotransferase